MEHTYWQRQAHDAPLFADLLWSRPENRHAAGKLLIVGGNLYGFAAAGEAYEAAVQAGVGATRVLLPDALRATVGRTFEAGEFAPSTPSGSFSQKALDAFLADAAWADGVLLAGDLGRNSETAILLEKFLAAYPGQLTIAKDAADYFTATPGALLSRPDTTLVISLAQLQKLAAAAPFHAPFTFGMDLLHLTAALHDFTVQYPLRIITLHLGTLFVAADGEISTTKLAPNPDIWRVRTAAAASVWWLQNPGRTFPALTTAAYTIAANGQHS